VLPAESARRQSIKTGSERQKGYRVGTMTHRKARSPNLISSRHWRTTSPLPADNVRGVMKLPNRLEALQTLSVASRAVITLRPRPDTEHVVFCFCQADRRGGVLRAVRWGALADGRPA